MHQYQIQPFTQDNFKLLCDSLATADADLAAIIMRYGYPPFWSRPNTFESLVHIILEQQVSLASALSALNKLRGTIQQITPARLLMLTDDELKTCYFSRQKAGYVKYLAEAVLSGQINLVELAQLPDHEVRNRLTAIKGIGNWTVDIYLLMVLHRTDVFPIGDLAIINAAKQVKQLPLTATKNEILHLAARWQPHRSIAAMLLWHYYLSATRK